MSKSAMSESAKSESAKTEHVKSYVVNRRGEHEKVHYDAITARNEDLCTNPRYGSALDEIDCPLLTQEIVARFRNGMTTRELDALTVRVCVASAIRSPDYNRLAARICVSDLHKRIPKSILAAVSAIVDAAPDAASVRYSDEYLGILRRAGPAIDAHLQLDRDYRLGYFGFQTMAMSYLMAPKNREEQSTLMSTVPMELPQHFFMRVALAVFCGKPDRRGHEAPEADFAVSLAKALAYYTELSFQRLSHATPTALNAGTKRSQLSSCFGLAPGDDLRSLLDVIVDTGLISKWSGGESIWLHSMRSEGMLIRGTGGRSNGITHYVRMLNEEQSWINQGGARKGAFAVYLSPDHADIFAFLRMGREKGVKLNAPDLKYGLFVSDRFMRALKRKLEGGDDTWHLFDPDTAPGLHRVHSAEYDALYDRYVAEGKFKSVTTASEIFLEFFRTLNEKGNPYFVFKDHMNARNNLEHIATICMSNLCTEIGLPCWSDFEAEFFGAEKGKGETFVCNLGAICLESFVWADGVVRDPAQWGAVGAIFDLKSMRAAATMMQEACDNVIDLTFYPTPNAERSNRRHRPIGIGFMGMADAHRRAKTLYGTAAAMDLEQALVATIHQGALAGSVRLGEERGSYPSLTQSQNGKTAPALRGLLQPDMWARDGLLRADWEEHLHGLTGGVVAPAGWAHIREKAKAGHMRNSLLTAAMPTATTSNMVDQCEGADLYMSAVYTRETLAGEFVVIDRHLIRELRELGLWSESMRLAILNAPGQSIQAIQAIPFEVRRRYKTAREVDPRFIARHAGARSPFIDQSQSTNYYTTQLTVETVLTALLESWELGNKTGSYYWHSSAASSGHSATSARPAAAAAAAAEDAEDADDGELPTCRLMRKNGIDCVECGV
jgi:ribonucleoside-diphosphate reductase alpha subunit